MIKNIFDAVDALGQSFVQTTFGELAGALATPLKAMLIVYVAAYGYSAAMGSRSFNVNDAFLRVVRVVLIVAFVTKWDVYSSFVVEIAMKAPDAVGGVVTKALGGDAPSLATNLGKFNDAIWTLAGQINAQGSMLSPSTAVLAGIVMLVGMVFVAVAAAMLMFAKMGMWILLALGPVFVILLLYEWSARFAMGWVNTIFSMMVAMVLVYGIGGFVLHIAEKAVAAATATQGSSGAAADLSLIAPILVTASIGALLLTQVPTLAAAMGSGGYFNTWLTGGAMFRAGKGAARGAVGVAGGAAEGGRAVLTAVRARRRERLEAAMNAKMGNGAA